MTTTNPPPPKRRPYNASGSLSEYGVFPECDAQQPTEDVDAVSAGGWYQGGDRTCGPNATTFRFIRDDNGIVAFVEGSRDVAMKRAARIVECVNACTGIADPAAFIRLAKQASAAGHLDRKRFERAPCYLCGYNGEGYYQPDKHPCAARYHAQQPEPSAPDYPITATCRVCDYDYRCVPVPAKCGACGSDLPPSTPVGAAEDMVLDAIERRESSAPVEVDAPGSRSWMAEVCRVAALSLAAHGVRNDQLLKVADWISQQPEAQQQKQESGGEVIQRHVVTKYRDGSVHVADIAAAECPHDWGQDEAHEDWARCYKCGISRRKPIAQQPAAEPRSTHRGWRKNDWLSCYFEALGDHYIGCEQQPASVDNEENQRTWQALWLVLRQTGTVVVPGSDIVSADWSRCQIEQTVHDSTGAVQFRATLLTAQQQGGE